MFNVNVPIVNEHLGSGKPLAGLGCQAAQVRAVIVHSVASKVGAVRHATDQFIPLRRPLAARHRSELKASRWNDGALTSPESHPTRAASDLRQPRNQEEAEAVRHSEQPAPHLCHAGLP